MAGRKSATALATPSPVERLERPAPPVDLTEAQADVWDRIVSAREGGYFDAACQQLLAQLCRHEVEARRVAYLIDRECARDDLDVAAYDLLLKAQARETSAINALSVKLRISPSSCRTDGTAGTAKRKMVGSSDGRRPWEV